MIGSNILEIENMAENILKTKWNYFNPKPDRKMKEPISAKEFRDHWLKANKNIIHIPSEHELSLMTNYAQYVLECKTN